MLEQEKRKAILAGVAIGAGFVIIGIIADLLYSNQDFTFSNIVGLYGSGPTHRIIILNSISLGIVFFYVQRQVISQKTLFTEEQQKSKALSANMSRFLGVIEGGDFDNAICDFGDIKLNALFSSLVAKLSKQKEDDNRANWVASGQARFSEILRTSNDLSTLSDSIISALVKFVNLNQGAIFIHNPAEGSEGTLSLTACYAYERKKYMSGFVVPGAGQVGQCFLEKESIILKKVPGNYVRITSGLGEATPTYVAIVPIKANDQVEGVLEIAGFRSLEDYQVKFVESICEAFASVIHSTKVSDQTRQLLQETQDQTNQLRQQEEEIRQNLEEMQATQEQLNRQLHESKILRERVERRERVMALTTILSETDLHGSITYANDKFCEIAKYDRSSLVGKPHNIVRHPDMPKEVFKLFWDTIKRGEVFRGIVKNRAKDGTHYWVDATIVPIKDEKGEVIKYVGSRYHITDDKLAVLLYNKQAATHHWPMLTDHDEPAKEVLAAVVN